MLEVGNVDGAGSLIESCLSSDHSSCVVKVSDARLVFYMAGYVARKFRSKSACNKCASELTVGKEVAKRDINSDFTQHFDKGGLLYPCSELAKLVSLLEDAFTLFFCTRQLYAYSIHDFMQFLTSVQLEQVGCDVHRKELTAKIIQFFVLTRLHFFTKSLNKEKALQRSARNT